ncbi:MCE family protein [Amycolatopsis minnesotensis]|uniref:MCE family protein n=1 Tax=Amycolatopsis minnesotensis TaxID=337894 RepID=A0ABN2SBY6_9PSEU
MKSFKERNPVTIGAIGSVVLAAVVTGTFYWQDLPLVGSGTSYAAEFGEAAGLQPDDEVRIAGIKVGEVSAVDLADDHVVVKFRVEDAWLGNKTSAEIKIKTLLGRKFLALHPLGDAEQDPAAAIPRNRTVTPYDVTEAFNGLANTVGSIDTTQLAQSFRSISDTFKDSPEHVRLALDGLSALSKTIASRDDQLAELLASAHKISGTLANSSGDFDKLLGDGNLLLTELANRRDAIHALLVGAQDLGKQLSGLVADNTGQLEKALGKLSSVTGILKRHNDDLDHALTVAGPYFRVVTNIGGSGHWIDSYVCGLVPDNRDPCTPPKGGGR